MIGTWSGGLENNGTFGDCLKYSIVEIGQEFREESWQLEETSCHSNSNEKPPAKNNVKNSQGK